MSPSQASSLKPQASLETSQLDYPMPHELIATRPAEPRDSARLLVVKRGGSGLEHAHVRDLPTFLRRGDAMVFNTTAVLPARIQGRRQSTHGRIDGLFVDETGPGRWQVMLRSNGRLHPGDVVELFDAAGSVSVFKLKLIERSPEGWFVRLIGEGSAASALAQVGRTPLPSYIEKARDGHEISDSQDRSWYQTVYADTRQHSRHSVAAPTAGLHFTPGLLQRLAEAGVGRIDVTLHVGPGTFRPITARTVREHDMHAERFSVTPEAIEAVAAARRGAGRVIAVGSTAVRTLESLTEPLPPPDALDGPVCGRTDLLIAPPYRFKHVDGMLTNFHLPRTTLLALVAAMVGLDRLREIYMEAIVRRYRFFSYGDAMLILP